MCVCVCACVLGKGVAFFIFVVCFSFNTTQIGLHCLHPPGWEMSRLNE